MDDLAQRRDAHEAAETYAQKYAPKPSWNPVEAGLVGALSVVMAIALFSGLAGVDIDQHGIAGAITAAVGFLVPYMHVRARQRKHAAVFRKEYDRVCRELDERSVKT